MEITWWRTVTTGHPLPLHLQTPLLLLAIWKVLQSSLFLFLCQDAWGTLWSSKTNTIVPRAMFWCLSLLCFFLKTGIPAFFSSRKKEYHSYLLFFLFSFSHLFLCHANSLNVDSIICPQTHHLCRLIISNYWAPMATFCAKSVTWIIPFNSHNPATNWVLPVFRWEHAFKIIYSFPQLFWDFFLKLSMWCSYFQCFFCVLQF